MAIALATTGFRFAQPWWLLAALLAAPMVYLAWRSLGPLGQTRRILATGLRVAVVALLAVDGQLQALYKTAGERLRIIGAAGVDRADRVDDVACLHIAGRRYDGEARG